MEWLECSKHGENIINRKVSIFYIETVLNFFFSTPKNIFSEIDRKKKKKKKVHIFRNLKKKSTFSMKNHMIFHWFFWLFSLLKKTTFCFSIAIFFFGVEIFLDIVSMQNFVLFRSMRFPDRFRHSFLANQPKRKKTFFCDLSHYLLYQVAENRELSVLREVVTIKPCICHIDLS